MLGFLIDGICCDFDKKQMELGQMDTELNQKTKTWGKLDEELEKKLIWPGNDWTVPEKGSWDKGQSEISLTWRWAKNNAFGQLATVLDQTHTDLRKLENELEQKLKSMNQLETKLIRTKPGLHQLKDKLQQKIKTVDRFYTRLDKQRGLFASQRELAQRETTDLLYAKRQKANKLDQVVNGSQWRLAVC